MSVDENGQDSGKDSTPTPRLLLNVEPHVAAGAKGLLGGTTIIKYVLSVPRDCNAEVVQA